MADQQLVMHASCESDDSSTGDSGVASWMADDAMELILGVDSCILILSSIEYHANLHATL